MSAVRLTGTVAELHGRDPFAGGPIDAPEVWWCDFTDAAIVLGSSQRGEVLDAAAVAARGLHVVRRRSGGGAVLLVPGAVIWIDLVLPAGAWPGDVRASMSAAGHVRRTALLATGAVAAQGLTVHAGGMVVRPWSAAVCFAGVGPGEVLDATGRKLVGLSQRRTRHGARLQGLVHVRPLVAATGALIDPSQRPEGAPEEAALVGTLDAERLARQVGRAAEDALSVS